MKEPLSHKRGFPLNTIQPAKSVGIGDHHYHSESSRSSIYLSSERTNSSHSSPR